MKKLTSEQQTRGAAIHARANTELRAAGFVCLRQFTAAGSAGTGESFEIWAKAGKTVIVQFYAQAGGAELYTIAGGNTWGDFSAHLAALTPTPTPATP